jgi:hypothetical protein
MYSKLSSANKMTTHTRKEYKFDLKWGRGTLRSSTPSQRNILPLKLCEETIHPRWQNGDKTASKKNIPQDAKPNNIGSVYVQEEN